MSRIAAVGRTLVVLTMALAPAAASANWLAPQTVDSGAVVGNIPPYSGSGKPHAAVSPAGVTTLVWGRQGGTLQNGTPTRTIRLVRIDPQGGVGAELTVSDPLAESHSPQVALAPDGTATVVWVTTVPLPERTRILARRVSPAGEMGPVLTLSDPAEIVRPFPQPRVAVGPGGVAHVVWIEDPGLGGPAQRHPLTRRIGADGSLGDLRTVPGFGYVDYGLTSGGAVAIAAAPDGGAVIAAKDRGAGLADSQTPSVRVARIAPDGTPGTAAVLTPAGDPRDVADPAVLVSADNVAHVAFRHGLAGTFIEDPWTVRMLAARIEPNGSVRDLRDVAPVANGGRPSLLGLSAPPALWEEPGGAISVAWHDILDQGFVTDAVRVRLNPDDTIGPVQTLVRVGIGDGGVPGFAARGPDGSALVAATAVNPGNTDLGIPLTRTLFVSRTGGPGSDERRVLLTDQVFEPTLAVGGDVAIAYWYGALTATGTVGFTLYSPRFPLLPVDQTVDPTDPVDPGPAGPPGTPGPTGPGGGAAPTPGVTPLPSSRLAARVTLRAVRVAGSPALRIVGTLPRTAAGRTLVIQRRIGPRLLPMVRLTVPRSGRIVRTVRLNLRRSTGALGVRGASAIRVRAVLIRVAGLPASTGPLRRVVLPRRR